jgi:hypothetical protein
MSGTDAIGGTNAGWTATTGASPVSKVAFSHSNAHQLKAFGLIIVFEAVAYAIDNCAVDSATIDFGLDAIASITWAGKGTAMRQLSSVTIGAPTGTPATVALSGGLSGTAKYKDTQAKYIANKLSTMDIAALNFGGLAAKTYSVAITGGSITINNNLTYLTPANLGVVNQPITYFTGSRAISATVTAYLKTGTNETAQLLSDLLTASSSSTENKFNVTVHLGGYSNANRIALAMPTTMLTIPTITSEQVISTSITLNPQGAAAGAYDIEAKNELEVSYYAAA